MRIKLDENLPAGLAARLSALGNDVETVPSEGLCGRPDPAVWEACQREKRFLITQDLDFSDVRRFAPGTHAGLLLVRLREPSRRALAERIENIFREQGAIGWEGCFMVATDRKLRVRRPHS
jgi:predicted nuclease of predicted toxin-antitoxin system